MKKRSLDQYRQSKEYGYKPKKYTEELCSEQTYKVKEKIEKMVDEAVTKLNSGSSTEKMMAVGIIQLVNQIETLISSCPNNASLGESFRQIFANKE